MQAENSVMDKCSVFFCGRAVSSVAITVPMGSIIPGSYASALAECSGNYSYRNPAVFQW